MQGDEGDVVLLLPVRTGEPVQGVEEPIEQLAAGVVHDHLLAQAREAVHLPVRVVCLDESVGVEQDVASRSDDRLGLLVLDPGQEAEGHPGGPQLDDAVVGADVREVVAGIGHDDPTGRRVEDREQAGHEHARRHLGFEQRVRSGQDLAGRIAPARLGAEHRMGSGHDQRRRHALVGHVADGDADPPVAHLDEVVEVATDGARRTVVRGDLPFGQVGQLARQELLLDERRDAHLLLEPLPFGGLGGLLADELGDADGRCGLGGEGRQQATVVGGVVLLGQPWAEVERADQLALRDQRDDERDTGGAEVADRRRVELEAGELDRSWRRLEVGEQRIGFGDVHRDRAPDARLARRPRPGRSVTVRLGGDDARGGLHDRSGGGSGGSVHSSRASCCGSGVRESLRDAGIRDVRDVDRISRARATTG